MNRSIPCAVLLMLLLAAPARSESSEEGASNIDMRRVVTGERDDGSS